MGKQFIPDGLYTVMGPGGRLTAMDGRITLMQPDFGPAPLQLWEAKFEKGSYTLRNMATRAFVGSDDPDRPDWMLRGTGQPFAWTLTEGDDGDPSTFAVSSTASSDNLRLAPSILRMWPPMAALAPPDFPAEWSFQPA